MKTIASFFQAKTTKKRPSLEAQQEEPEKMATTRSSSSDGDNDGSRKRAKLTTAAAAEENQKQDAPGEKKPAAAVSSKDTDVQELLASLEEPGWKAALEENGIFRSSKFTALAKFVAKERESHTVFPPPHDTWSALNLCPLEETKVVILGQDPYHGPNQAHGLCFSVLPGQVPPPSLKNIFVELESDDKVKFAKQPKGKKGSGHLIRWSQQGVLLLNNVLSVRQGEPNSHQKKGWEQVTHAILQCLRQRKCVFLVWGKPAAQRIEALHAPGKSKNHVVIASSHPSPLGARKTNAPFIGSQCFSRCNTALEEMGLEAIDWNLEGPLPNA